MRIQDYKNAAIELNEFVQWSRTNYTRTPKIRFLRAEKFAKKFPFKCIELKLAAEKLGAAFEKIGEQITKIRCKSHLPTSK